MTESGVEAHNYPFCTIEPNLGVVEVPDPRLFAIRDIVSPQKTIPAQMSFLDIAGLVAGASEGEGLGNKFLGHIREVEAVAHVIRCFEDENVTHVDGSVDPVRDILTIETELRLADIQTIERAILKIKKLAKSGNKEEVRLLGLYEDLLEKLSSEEAMTTWGDELHQTAQNLHLLICKPMMYIANISDPTDEDNEYVRAVKQYAAGHGRPVLAICAKLESELVGLDADEKLELLNELDMSEPGLNRVIRMGYSLLGLETFFTAGPKEVRAWTIKKGYLANQAAGVIHTDFEKHFIRAEVIAYQDYINCKGEQVAKDQGLWRLEGKDYTVIDGDVIYFRTSA